MQNDRQRCKIKVRKFPLNILWRFGVMGKNPKGAGSAPPPGMDRVKLGDQLHHGTLEITLSICHVIKEFSVFSGSPAKTC